MSVSPSVCLFVHPEFGVCHKKINFATSTKVTDKCCCICFSNEKYHLGGLGASPGHLQGKTKSWPNEKKLLTKGFRYVSVMKKITTTLRVDPQHSPGGVQGSFIRTCPVSYKETLTIYFSFMISFYCINAFCKLLVCIYLSCESKPSICSK